MRYPAICFGLGLLTILDLLSVTMRTNGIRITTLICLGIGCSGFLRAGEETPAATPPPDKSQYNLFNPTPVDLRRAYNTDRPSKTDSPFTVDAGVFQIADEWMKK